MQGTEGSLISDRRAYAQVTVPIPLLKLKTDTLTRKRSLVGSGDGEGAGTKTLVSCHPAGRVVAPDLYIRPARDGV